MISENELLKNNGKIVEFWFDRFFKTKNILHIENLLNIVSHYSQPNIERAKTFDDIKKAKQQLTLFLMSRYIMELFSFYINIKNDET
ncbi:hypothetical protein FACS1894190_16290 [Spirochaetia bacterium]|nr:hypothetical protein FACS1894190_16290 [Spirochaetia bacterium]